MKGKSMLYLKVKKENSWTVQKILNNGVQMFTACGIEFPPSNKHATNEPVTCEKCLGKPCRNAMNDDKEARAEVMYSLHKPI